MIDGTEKLDAKEGTTGRGFGFVEFKDLYGQQCSFQESSIATAACIWLGVDNKGKELSGCECGNKQVNARMHLNRKQAAQLASMLNRFARLEQVSVYMPTKEEQDLEEELDDMHKEVDDDTTT